MSTVSEHIERATAAGLPAGFVHGPWQLRDRWAAVASPRSGYAPTLGGGRCAPADTALACVTRCA
jgi:hypothetical protein